LSFFNKRLKKTCNNRTKKGKSLFKKIVISTPELSSSAKAIREEERLKREQKAESQKFGFIGRIFVNEQVHCTILAPLALLSFLPSSFPTPKLDNPNNNPKDQEIRVRLLSTISHKYLARLSEGIYRVTLVTERDEDVKTMPFALLRCPRFRKV
jgi:hypothetical protein